MSHAVELVGFVKVGPFMIRILDDEVGVDVSVALLCLAYGLDDLLGFGLKRGIRSDRERISDCFQPLGHVAVLEHHPVELSLGLSRGDAEVLEGVALLGSLYLIVHDLVLIRYYRVYDEILKLRPERVGDLYIVDA